MSPFSQALVPSDSTRGRRAQDDFDYQHSQGFPERERRALVDPVSDPAIPGQRPAYAADPSGPAWLYAPPAPVAQRPLSPPPPQSSVADTLQHSRARVAARLYALKGVFEQPGQEQPEPAPVRQKETRTPVRFTEPGKRGASLDLNSQQVNDFIALLKWETRESQFILSSLHFSQEQNGRQSLSAFWIWCIDR